MRRVHSVIALEWKVPDQNSKQFAIMKNLSSSSSWLLPWASVNESPVARHRSKDHELAMMLGVALALGLSVAARAASVSFSSTPPAVGPSDISQLTGAATKPNNIGPDDDSVYIASNRPIQGQTFTTGGNANGYSLAAITLKQAAYDTYALVPDMTYTIRITSPSGSTLAVLAEETASVPEDATDCNTCNFPTISSGNNSGPGSGRFITFTFASPVVLNPNTTYGFDVGGRSTFHYWETDGTTNSNAYAGGTAYSSGSDGVGGGGMTERAGDRVFVVALTAASAPLAPRIHIQPKPVALYATRTVQFAAKASGSPTLVYQWQKNSTPVANGGNVSGATTDSLTLANIAAGDAGSYTLVVTNSASSGNSVTSAPAVLTVVAAPAPGSYGNAVLTNNPVAYWRMDEMGNPATNPPAYDYAGGFVGTYEIGSSNGFNGIVGPRPIAFPGFESTNNAVQTTGLGDSTTPTWVTTPPLNLNTNRVTMAAWIHPNGDQAPGGYTGLFIVGGGNAGFAYGGDFSGNAGELIYWWAGGAYTFKSGLVIPPNQWSFVAVVIEPTKATLYLGSGGSLKTAIDSTGHTSETFGASGQIGHQPGRGPDSRVFNGSIDDVAVFNRSLSFDEINTLYGSGLGSIQPRAPTILKQPLSSALYAGRTARFDAIATGSSPLNYQWQKNGANVTNGGSVSGAQTDSLTISNASVGDSGAYTLVVSNLANPPATSAPPATLTVGAPSGKPYETAVLSASPVAYWRLNETGDPSTNTPAFDFWGGLTGTYSTNAQNGFDDIAGPRPADFSQFETNNYAFQAKVDTAAAWVSVPALNLNTNTVTITAWINPNVDPITAYAAIFYSRRGSADPGGVGIQYTSDNQIGYTWNGGQEPTWGFLSGLRAPANQWSFVAVVIDPTKATLYLYNKNGQFSTNNAIPHTSEAWDGSALIGADPNHLERTFDGMIDEVAVFNYAFTQTQVQNLYNAVVQPPQPTLTATRNTNGTLAIGWDPPGTGRLESTTTFNGTNTVWNSEGTISPVTVTPTGTAKFYRVFVP